ncbi:MAG: TonB-dependent receptor domain-containing protein [Phocaeicola sp.]|uniref:TonB-dependent receptor domain-containing protein n=2 Tax=Phocaeicola sp. TaxID=2773926 RepID=UPI003F9FBEB8
MKNISSLCALLFLILLGYTPFICAQTLSDYSVKGVLVDSITLEKEPYATIRIMKQADLKNPVKLAVTDINGKFNERIPAIGKYLLTITSIGKKTVIKNFEVTPTKKHIDLGTLYTKESTEELKGVEVVAQKPLVKAEIDKISYSIEDDPDSKTNTTLEMLRKVPLVTVDGEDNIQVNGSSSFKVYVNGKPNSLMSNNPKEVLRSLPATSIKTIEVITEPGAKYDAEGVGGILNIITTGTKMEGYTATLSARASNTGIGANAYSTVQIGKVTLTGNYSYNYENEPKSIIDEGREDYTSDKYYNLVSHNERKNKGNFQLGQLEGSYEIDSLNLVTFNANMFGGSFRSPTNWSSHMFNKSGDLMYAYHRGGYSKNSFGNVGANLDYQHSFKKKGKYLTLSYKLDYTPNGFKSETTYDSLYQVPYILREQYSDIDSHTTEHTAQLDLVNPITDKHYIDFGAKYIYRINYSDAKMYQANDNGTLEYYEAGSSKYQQDRNIIAGYFDYQLKLTKWGFKAGFRYEHTFMDVKYDLTPERNFHTNYDDIVPTVNISYMLAQTKTLRFNYNLRINRPSIWYLNPFVDRSDPNSISYGNPDLDTEKAHNLGLTFSSFSQKFNINTGFNYFFINNGIERYQFINNGVLETTFGNVGHTQNVGYNMWVNWNPTNNTRISINGSERYSDYKSDELNARRHGWSTNLFGNIQQTLPWKLRFSMYGGGSTKHVTLQGTVSSSHYYGISLSKSFLKEDRLNISAYANHFLSQYTTYRDEKTTDTFHSWSESRYPSRGFGINISWRFGKLNAQVKHTNRSIINDDTKAGGNSQGQSETGGGN